MSASLPWFATAAQLLRALDEAENHPDVLRARKGEVLDIDAGGVALRVRIAWAWADPSRGAPRVEILDQRGAILCRSRDRRLLWLLRERARLQRAG
ncbi:hypothetical protein FBR04_08425 [Betaproteobacteria bacterium PRO7]|nr:hypothetical protein [Betaproteobacteria bacterium PRO7]